MPQMTKYRPGVPCWVDASSADMPASAAFYTSLFGWTARDNGPEMGNYHSFLIDGKQVAGMGPAQSPDAPSAWCTFIATDDIDKTAALVGDAGGTVLLAPMEVPMLGHMMLAIDSAGSYFGVWQAIGHPGSELVNQANTPVWHECQTSDPKASQDFYSKVFGWTYEAAVEGGADYWTIIVDGRSVGGMIAMTGDAWKGIPSNWMTYFLVDDVDAMEAKVTELGGTVMHGATDMSAGRFCIAAGPEGAMFAMLTSSNVDDPNTGWNS